MVIAAVTRHQKKENHDKKVAGIKILGQQPPQKTANALLGPGLWLGKGRTVWRSIATGAVLWRTTASVPMNLWNFAVRLDVKPISTVTWVVVQFRKCLNGWNI